MDSGLGDDDEAVPSKLDKDFTAEPPSVIGVIAFSFFVVPGAIIFGGVGVWLLFFSIMNPYHEDGGLVGFVCMGIPLTLVGLFCFLLWWAGVIKERLRVQHSRDRLVYQATLLGLGLPPLRGLGLLSEKRRLSEAVYLETDKDGDDASDDPRELDRIFANWGTRESSLKAREISNLWLPNWRNPRIHTTHPTKKRRER